MPRSIRKKGDGRPQDSPRRARWPLLSHGPATPEGGLDFRGQRPRVLPPRIPVTSSRTRQPPSRPGRVAPNAPEPPLLDPADGQVPRQGPAQATFLLRLSRAPVRRIQRGSFVVQSNETIMKKEVSPVPSLSRMSVRVSAGWLCHGSCFGATRHRRREKRRRPEGRRKQGRQGGERGPVTPEPLSHLGSSCCAV